MMTDKSTKEQDNQRKDQQRKDVELQEQEAALHAKKKSEQFVQCTRCGYDLYSDEDSEFDGKSGRMHHIARCFELSNEANARMKQHGAKDPDDDVRAKKRADMEKDSKAKSIEANRINLDEIVAGRNPEPWQIALKEQGGPKEVKKAGATPRAEEKPTAKEKKTAEATHPPRHEESIEKRTERTTAEKLPQDKQLEHVHGEKEKHE